MGLFNGKRPAVTQVTMSASQTGRDSQGGAILRGIVAPYKGRIALLSILSLGSALLEALFIVLLTSIGLALVGGKDHVGPVFDKSLTMTAALLVAGGALILRVGLSLWGVRVSAALTAMVTTAQRLRLSHAFLRTSWASQQAEPSGRLQQLLTGFVGQIAGSVSTLSTVITAGLSLIAFLGMGFTVDAVSTGAVLIALGIVGSILTPVRRAIRRRSAKNAQVGLAFANAVSELGSMGLEMQTFGAESRFEARIDELTQESTAAQRRTQELQGALPILYMSLAYSAVLAGVAALAVTGFSSLGVMGAVMLLMLRSLSYGQQLSTASASIAASLPFLEDVERTVERYVEARATPGSAIPAAATPLSARGLGYAYTADRPALADVDVTLQQGEALGVVGPSGAGKSTLAQLLLGLRQPTAGDILVSGHPLNEVDHSWWTDRVAFVAQEARLITGTVADNIRFFREGITDEDMQRAARQANFLQDIESLPQGFDTHLGERGNQLSGGQKQRLSIARALAGEPELLILDEPTSALDGQSEALIRSTLAALRGQMSVVIIAHRMSTLDICDRIAVIEDGRLTALDTPSALRTDSKFYRNALAVAGIN